MFFFFSLRILLHRWWRATWRGRTLPYHRSRWWRHQCQRRTAWYSWSWGCYGMVTFVILFFFINPSILVILLLRSITLSNSVNEFFPWNFQFFAMRPFGNPRFTSKLLYSFLTGQSWCGSRDSCCRLSTRDKRTRSVNNNYILCLYWYGERWFLCSIIRSHTELK